MSLEVMTSLYQQLQSDDAQDVCVSFVLILRLMLMLMLRLRLMHHLHVHHNVTHEIKKNCIIMLSTYSMHSSASLSQHCHWTSASASQYVDDEVMAGDVPPHY